MTRIKKKAGGIVYRRDEEGEWILVVTAKKHPENWIFPKGHIEDGETPAECAVREVKEESGVDAEIVELVGSAEYDAGDDTIVHIQYYLLRFLAEGETDEPRRVRWCRYEHALDLVAFDTLRQLLPEARRLICEIG